MSIPRRWNNQLKTIFLLGALSTLVVGIGGALAPGQLALFVGLALAMNVGAYFFSDRIVLRVHGAREVSAAEAPRLHALVDDLVGRAGMPKPRVAIIQSGQPNAFATGRSPRHGVVAVTTGILDLLSPRELRGVLAHELAHIANRDTLVATIAAAAASAVTYVAHAMGFGAIAPGGDEEENGASPLALVAAAVVAPLAATLVQLSISRARELAADHDGARIAGDPLALASALAKLDAAAHAMPAEAEPATASLFIVNPLAGGTGIARWFSTHPATEERIRRLERLAGGERRVA
ncbi:MAG TPA: M48 family metalloprotease [Candidatus Binatia bacterium]|nr:M48 family metalloprotease [Candidatus Binatia bacterium]